ncbi:MAG TPA: peptidoglycan-binding domain-containing protein [bacterium]|nr:peptidoglycan-binding domain-containing protein [bacterium]
MTKKCDCSGFAAWSIGIPRHLPAKKKVWLQTTSYWNGGIDTGQRIFDQVAENAAQPGDIVVYPDIGGKQGHMGFVSRMENGVVTRVIHCSKSNYTNHGDAILETAPTAFRAKKQTRFVQVNYPALRSLLGIAESVQPDAVSLLKSPLLKNDGTLQMVAMGLATLTATGKLTPGCAALHDAINTLAHRHPAYFVDLGQNQRYRGFYGAKTKQAVINFQKDQALPTNGNLDRDTLLALDNELVSGRDVSIVTPLEAPEKPAAIELQHVGNRYYATFDDGQQVYIGKRVTYAKKYVGLANTDGKYEKSYEPAQWKSEYDHWAYMIYPTAICESRGCFNCINTYDSARFTFGFVQMAAHTPNENFVPYFRSLLELPKAGYYFPDLQLIDGHVARQTTEGWVLLEDDKSTKRLKNYLNPSVDEVEDQEAINAAKLIHWSSTDQSSINVQVKTAVDKIRYLMKINHRRYNLDGKPDTICAVIADIHHQGRAKVPEVAAALNKAANDDEALHNLLQVNRAKYKNRCETLEKTVNRMVQDGLLGRKRYDARSNSFN